MTRDVQFVRSVDLPFTQVRDKLRDEASQLFGTPGPEGAEAVLSAHLGDLDISRTMVVNVLGFEESADTNSCRVSISGDASSHPELFPHLEAWIDAVAVGDDRTVLFFAATYKPPLGVVGGTVDALMLHRFAEDSLEDLFAGAAFRLG